MSDKIRWRFGETRSVVASVASNVAIETGDLVFWDSSTIYPASATQIAASLDDTQAEFASKFLGVALESSPLDVASSVRVATSGVFEFDCERATYRLGELVGVAANSRTQRLANQKTLKVAAPELAIGKVFRQFDEPSATVYVDVRSTVFK